MALFIVYCISRESPACLGKRDAFEKRRSCDAELSSVGIAQTGALSRGIARAVSKQLSPKVREKGLVTRRVCLAISPMKRTILTSMPILESLQNLTNVNGSGISLESVQIVPHIFEVGGCYNEVDGVFVGQPGLTKSEIQTLLPSAKIPDELYRGWWTSKSRETEHELEIRVTQTVDWIKATACSNTFDILIIVTHQDFACTCMRRLLNAQSITWLYNASFSSLTLHPTSLNSNGYSNESHGDSTITQTHSVRVVTDWINSVDHLPLEHIT